MTNENVSSGKNWHYDGRVRVKLEHVFFSGKQQHQSGAASKQSFTHTDESRTTQRYITLLRY